MNNEKIETWYYIPLKCQQCGFENEWYLGTTPEDIILNTPNDDKFPMLNMCSGCKKETPQDKIIDEVTGRTNFIKRECNKSQIENKMYDHNDYKGDL